MLVGDCIYYLLKGHYNPNPEARPMCPSSWKDHGLESQFCFALPVLHGSGGSASMYREKPIVRITISKLTMMVGN